MITTRKFHHRLMLMTNYYLKIMGKVKYGGNLPLHTLKSIIGDMIILLTLTGHLSCLPQQHGYTFMVTSSMMQMITARDCFRGYLLRILMLTSTR